MIILFLFAWADCGSDEAKPAGGVVALDDLAPRVAEVFCGKALECCSEAEISARAFDSPATDEAGCAGWVESRMQDGRVPEIEAAEAAGGATYDAAAAGACLATLGEMGCAEFATDGWLRSAEVGLGCAIVVPAFGEGDACARGFECATGFCDAGTCAPRVGEGEPCAADEACEDGLVCDGTCGPPGAPTCDGA